jgi:hypothetical protein
MHCYPVCTLAAAILHIADRGTCNRVRCSSHIVHCCETTTLANTAWFHAAGRAPNQNHDLCMCAWGAWFMDLLHTAKPSTSIKACVCFAVLMAMASIYWDMEHYSAVERIFRQSAEFCSDNEVWKLNVAHTFFMQVRGNIFQISFKHFCSALSSLLVLLLYCCTWRTICQFHCCY